MGLNIKFYDDKQKEGEIVSVGYIPVDTKARKDSKRLASSGAVAKVEEKVGDASAALQDQIDEIAKKAGSGYIPKGEATVATLNALSGQENGELYTMTDAGTLTDGSLAVVAGDTVAWDATNEVWYKAMDYAPRQYGTNEVHNLPTSITAFRTGDVIPVDGPSGTAKMPKDSLLQETAENALVKVNNTENLSFIVKSAQRFNYQNVTRGFYYYSNGTFVDDASYVKSEFIRIGEETTMWFNKIAHITFWDADGNYISGVVNGSEAWSSAISIPAGAYYVCVGTLKNTARNAVLNFGASHLVLTDPSKYRYWEDLKFGIDRTCNTFKLPFVKDRKLCCNIVSASRTAYYSSVNLGSNVYKFNVSWIWEAGTSTGTIAVIINPNGMNRIKNITDSSIHLTLNANKLKVDCLGDKWGEYYYVNLIEHTFDTPMDLDGTTEHTLSLTINLNGENIAVNVDGESYAGVFTDTHGNNLHLSDFYGPYATIEHYCEGNRYDKAMPMFTSFKALAIGTPSAFDCFERENGVLQCTPTGHPYSLMVNDSRFA